MKIKMRTKRYLALLIAAVMMFSFAACETVSKYSFGDIYALSNVLPLGYYRAAALKENTAEKDFVSEAKLYSKNELAKLEGNESFKGFGYVFDDKEVCKKILRAYFAKLIENENCKRAVYSYENGTNMIIEFESNRGYINSVESFKATILKDAKLRTDFSRYLLEAFILKAEDGSYIIFCQISPTRD